MLTSNAYCLQKDSNGLVTGVVANSTIDKVLTVDEQKKALGIVTETATKVNEERVVKQGDYTYVVYDKNGKRLTSFKFKDNIVTWRGVKFKNIKRVGVIQKSKNLVLTTSKDSVVIVDFDDMDKETVFTAGETKGKASRYIYNSRGFVTSYVTSKGAKKSLKNY